MDSIERSPFLYINLKFKSNMGFFSSPNSNEKVLAVPDDVILASRSSLPVEREELDWELPSNGAQKEEKAHCTFPFFRKVFSK